MVRYFIYGKDDNEGSVYDQQSSNSSCSVLVPGLRVTSLSFESVDVQSIAVHLEMRKNVFLNVFHAEAINVYKKFFSVQM